MGCKLKQNKIQFESNSPMIFFKESLCCIHIHHASFQIPVTLAFHFHLSSIQLCCLKLFWILQLRRYQLLSLQFCTISSIFFFCCFYSSDPWTERFFATSLGTRVRYRTAWRSTAFFQQHWIRLEYLWLTGLQFLPASQMWVSYLMEEKASI